jgi:hypothetical protein
VLDQLQRCARTSEFALKPLGKPGDLLDVKDGVAFHERDFPLDPLAAFAQRKGSLDGGDSPPERTAVPTCSESKDGETGQAERSLHRGVLHGQAP